MNSTENSHSVFGFFSPRTFQRWSRNFFSPFDFSDNWFFACYYWGSNPNVIITKAMVETENLKQRWNKRRRKINLTHISERERERDQKQQFSDRWIEPDMSMNPARNWRAIEKITYTPQKQSVANSASKEKLKDGTTISNLLTNRDINVHISCKSWLWFGMRPT